ncbi:hypothetical protein ONZ45_g13409 [Pleurotus djamor]|nr:hypothetical protein ONZ45_g13409 [Pleurotus djamor]
MFSSFRVAPRVARRTVQPCHRIGSCSRYISTSRVTQYSDLAPDPPTEQADEPPEVDTTQEALLTEDEIGPVDPKSYQEFLDTVAAPFKEAKQQNWLGGKVPFPLNTSFRPPAPISDSQRTRMYEEFIRDPVKNDARALAQKYHLSIKRVDAILRLKGMEADWVKGKQLQTGFQAGMEEILGTKGFAEIVNSDLRYDAQEADSLEEEENRDALRQRYQRSYWESTPEDGREPIVPAALEHAKALAKRIAKQTERHKSDPEYMSIVSNDKLFVKGTPKEYLSQRKGEPSIKFVDVGGKYMDVDNRLRRLAGAEIKARSKAKRKLQDA